MTSRDLLTLRIELMESQPLIWRRIQIPADLDLAAAGDIIQIAMGWENSHLQSFHSADPTQGWGKPQTGTSWCDQLALDEELEGQPQEGTTLGQALAVNPGTLFYVYDFGDNWTHRLTLESSTPCPDRQCAARVLEGELRAPVEDSGGLSGWYDKLEEFNAEQPTEEQQETIDWLRWRSGDALDFDPMTYNQQAANRELELYSSLVAGDSVFGQWLRAKPSGVRRYALILASEAGITEGTPGARIPEWFFTEMVRPFQVLIELAQGEGIKLTPASWMNPKAVAELVERLQWEGIDYESSSRKREHSMHTVAQLREVARMAGLVRVYRGHVLATKKGSELAGDEQRLARHLLNAINTAEKDEGLRDGTIAYWLCRAAGIEVLSDAASDYITEVMNSLGYRMGPLGQPLGRHAVVHRSTVALLFEELARWHRRDSGGYFSKPAQEHVDEFARMVLQAPVS